MKILLTLVMLVGVLLLPGPLWAQVADPKAPEAGEVHVTATPSQTGADLVKDVNMQLSKGVGEVQVRGLTSKQVDDLKFLSTTATDNGLVKIGSQLKPGQHVDFRTTDGQRFRVKMTDSGQLRYRLRDVNLGTMTAQDLAKAFPAGSRVEIRGVDAQGNRIRYEVRNGVVKKDEVKADHRGGGREGTSATINKSDRDRGKDLDHSMRGRDRAEGERMERADRSERTERREQHEKSERSGRH